MANVVEAICRAARAWLARRLWIGALVACVVGRMAAFWAQRLCSTWSTSVGWLPAMRQQFVDLAVQLRGQPREHVLEVGPGVSPVELGRLQQAHHHRGALAGQLAADEQPMAPSKRPGPHLARRMVGLDWHLAIQSEL